MDWNRQVLGHPALTMTDKLVYHLLLHFGGDDLAIRRQVAALLHRSERHIRRVCQALRRHGFGLEGRTPLTARGQGYPPARTSLTAGTDIYVHRGHP